MCMYLVSEDVRDDLTLKDTCWLIYYPKVCNFNRNHYLLFSSQAVQLEVQMKGEELKYDIIDRECGNSEKIFYQKCVKELIVFLRRWLTFICRYKCRRVRKDDTMFIIVYFKGLTLYWMYQEYICIIQHVKF